MLRLGCGPFTGQRTDPRDPQGVAAIVDRALIAEQVGFDSVWLSEHHFAADGYLGALFPVLGAIAARTRRVELGTRVLLAPLDHPLHVAEDTAVVAAIAGRRVILGLGSGYRAAEFTAFGVPMGERARRLEDTMAICEAAWQGEPVSHQGIDVDADGITCGPALAPPPEIWLGGRHPNALARAARLATGYIAPLGDADDTATLLASLDAAVATGGTGGTRAVATSSYVALTATAAGRSAADGIHTVLETYAAMTGDGASAPRNRGVTLGSAAEVCDWLVAKHDAVGPGREHHLVVRLDFPGMTATAVEDHLADFAESVARPLRERVGA